MRDITRAYREVADALPPRAQFAGGVRFLRLQGKKHESIKVSPNAKVWIVLEGNNGENKSDNES